MLFVVFIFIECNGNINGIIDFWLYLLTANTDIWNLIFINHRVFSENHRSRCPWINLTSKRFLFSKIDICLCLIPTCFSVFCHQYLKDYHMVHAILKKWSCAKNEVFQYFFNKCDQIPRKRRIWSHLLKKSLMENSIFCLVILQMTGGVGGFKYSNAEKQLFHLTHLFCNDVHIWWTPLLFYL